MEQPLDYLEDKKLHCICQNLGVAGHKQYSRQEMINTLKKMIIPNERKEKRKWIKYHKPEIIMKIKKIQRWWRHQYYKTHFINSSDFITLDPITVKPFTLIEDSYHVYQFHPMTLANYFVKEGNFVNPYTRRPINVIELRRLDKMVKCYDEHFISLVQEQKRITIQRSQEREHQRVCQLLHSECFQIVRQIITLIHTRVPLTRMLIQLNTRLLPLFFDTFRQLFLLDHEFACDSIVYIITTLQCIWHDVRFTRHECFFIETALNTLTQFTSHILPSLPVLLTEFVNNMSHENQEPVR
jgi:hypothetical protein